MERRFSFSTNDKNKPYYDLAKAENGSDGSIYLSLPDVFGNTGAHYSFHASRRCHFRTSNPAASSSTFELDDLLLDIDRKRENFFTNTDLSRFGPGRLAILRIDEICHNIQISQDIYTQVGKRLVVSSPQFRNMIQKTTVYPYENMEKETEQLMKNRIIRQNDILIAMDSDSGLVFTGIPALGKNYGVQTDLNSCSSFNKFPGYEILQKPIIELLNRGVFNNMSGSNPLPFF